MSSGRIGLLAALALVALGILVSGHAYLATRLVLEPGIEGAARGVLLGVIAGGGLLLVLEPIAGRTLGPARARLIAWPAALWMGFAFLLLVGLLASELVLAVARVAAGELGDPALVARVRAAAVAGVAAVAGGLGLASALRGPRIERVEVRLRRWPAALDGLRIVQLSDLHLGPTRGRRFAAELAERANALRPDLVAVTGDLVDGDARRLAGEVAPLAGLRARLGVFFVTGNHDHYAGANACVELVRALGMQPLRNAHVVLEDGGAPFVLAGVDDHRGGFVDGQREDLPRALSGRDPALPVVLLAHDPTTFTAAARAGVDLQLSGHTHAGQIWPFRYAVRLVVPYVGGRYARDGSELYVSRGTGFWGPPMRLLSPAEITELTLRPADAK